MKLLGLCMCRMVMACVFICFELKKMTFLDILEVISTLFNSHFVIKMPYFSQTNCRFFAYTCNAQSLTSFTQDRSLDDSSFLWPYSLPLHPFYPQISIYLRSTISTRKQWFAWCSDPSFCDSELRVFETMLPHGRSNLSQPFTEDA